MWKGIYGIYIHHIKKYKSKAGIFLVFSFFFKAQTSLPPRKAVPIQDRIGFSQFSSFLVCFLQTSFTKAGQQQQGALAGLSAFAPRETPGG